MTAALEARVAGVVADYQDDPRVAALRDFWPELADSLDDMTEMWHRTNH